MNSTEFRNLEINVSDFGPIEDANVDLRPLTVFVGPSNTGKSYLAILIYALHKFFSGGFEKRILYPGFRRSSIFGTAPINEIADTAGLSRMIKELLSEDESHVEELIVPERVARSLVRPNLERLTILSDEIEAEVARVFGVDEASNLKRHRAKGDARVQVRRSFWDSNAVDDGFSYEIVLSDDSVEMSASVPDTPSGMPAPLGTSDLSESPAFQSLSLRRLRRDDDLENPILLRRYLAELTNMVGSRVFDPITQNAYYLPADRAGVMHAHRVVVSSLYRRASRGGIDREAALPTLSGVLADFLEELLYMEDTPPQKGGRRDATFSESQAKMTAKLQKEILGGTVQREESTTGYPVYSYRPTGWRRDLPLMSVSSMVAELAPIVLYLRNVVHQGEVLIIEEPEAHLHPAIQVEFLRQLALTVKQGVRIILTTHSEWVLEELANLVRLSELSDESREGILGAEAALSPEQVGAWLFEPGTGAGGSHVTEMPLDIQRGSYQAGYGLVTEDLYDRWVTINQRIDEIGLDG